MSTQDKNTASEIDVENEFLEYDDFLFDNVNNSNFIRSSQQLGSWSDSWPGSWSGVNSSSWSGT